MMNSKTLKTVLSIGMLVFMLFFVIAPVLAASNIVDGLNTVGGATSLGKQDIRSTIGSIINVALGFLGVVAIVIVLIGGFKYMIAGGNEEKVGDAKKWIISGIIGLAIILSAYAITTFVVTNLITATSDTGVVTSD